MTAGPKEYRRFAKLLKPYGLHLEQSSHVKIIRADGSRAGTLALTPGGGAGGGSDV